MNLLDATITEIIGEPYYKYDRWCLKVKYDCYGSESETTLMQHLKDDIDKVKVGDTIKV